MLTSSSGALLRSLKGNFLLKKIVISALEIETFDILYEIISPFGMLKECPGGTR
jgi:putative lipoic acid-binding regulatory protein